MAKKEQGSMEQGESKEENSGDSGNTVDDYYRELSARPRPNMSRYANGQVKQSAGQDLSPADGGDGYIGSPTGPSVGATIVSGKKGYVESRPVWSTQSSEMGVTANAGSSDGDPKGIVDLQDSRDEFATYKKAQTDEGLPQTYRTAYGAGDAGVSGSDEPDVNGTFGGADSNEGHPDTQDIPGTDSGDHAMDMPQTEFTRNDGGGAPRFKHVG